MKKMSTNKKMEKLENEKFDPRVIWDDIVNNTQIKDEDQITFFNHPDK